MLVKIDLQKNLTAIGNNFDLEQVAKQETGCARMTLAIQLYKDDSTLEEKQTSVTAACKVVYAGAYGKVKDETQVKSVMQCRQVVATMKKAASLDISPESHDTYSAFRTAVYKTEPLTKLALVSKWCLDDKEKAIDLAKLTKLVGSLTKTEADLAKLTKLVAKLNEKAAK
mgnify:FL=1